MTIPALDDHPKRRPGTASRSMDGEVVIVDPEHNMVRLLNPVGSRIWELADGTRSVATIVDMLVGEFEVDPAEAQKSVIHFITELQAKELLLLV